MRRLAPLFLILAATALVHPALFAHRFGPQPTRDLESFWRVCLPIARALSVPLGSIGLFLLIAPGAPDRRPGGWLRRGQALPIALCLVSYLALSATLFDWIIDDAGISFAYARNWAEGHGLRLHPAHPPEEGYSNFLWVLILAAVSLTGAELAVSAKLLGAAATGLTIVLAMRLGLAHVERKGWSDELLLPAGAILTSAPFVIWTSSGLENALVAVLTVLLIGAPATARPRGLTALSFALLVLTRPEAPLLVGVVIVMEALADPDGPRSGLCRQAGLAVPALLAMAAQQVFRLAYFGDPFSNPTYIKAAGLNPLRLVNVFGGGWIYTMTWLRSTHLLLVVPVVLLGTRRPIPPVLRRALAVLLAQTAFVLMVNGDWMKAWRFYTTAHAPLAILVIVAMAELARAYGPARARALSFLLTFAIGLATVSVLVDFRWSPVTPMHHVARVAGTFQELARRLGIEHPRLATHDAGGSSYVARIDLVDLGGLGNRDIARNRTDRGFMRHYLFEKTRPEFFWSDDRYHAALWCRFHHMEEFSRDYVPLVLPAALGVPAPICALRRDLVREAPGVQVLRDGPLIEKVLVEF